MLQWMGSKQITVNLGLSPRFTLEAIDELYEGIRLACEAYNVDLVGGDIVFHHQDYSFPFQF